jgi:hypothetical protein
MGSAPTTDAEATLPQPKSDKNGLQTAWFQLAEAVLLRRIAASLPLPHDADGPLFRPLKNPAGQGDTQRPLTHGAVYHRVLRKHAKAAGIDGKSFGPHALRATAATNALDRGADLGKVQERATNGPRVLDGISVFTKCSIVNLTIFPSPPSTTSLISWYRRNLHSEDHQIDKAILSDNVEGRETGMKKSESQKSKSPSQLIDARIKELGDWRGKMLRRLRTLVKEADPEVVEEWKWRGVPVWSHAGMICTGETYKNVVKMTFAKGASLEDPSGLFNSSLEGNTRRAIDFHEGDRIDEKALKALIRAAVTLNKSKAQS